MDLYRKAVIGMVKAHPVLWDPTHPQYKNNEMRKKAWVDIEEKLPTPAGYHGSPKIAWDHLTRGFANAIRRREKRSMKGLDHNNYKAWHFERDMDFLIPAKQSRIKDIIFPYPAPTKEELDSLVSSNNSDDNFDQLDNNKDTNDIGDESSPYPIELEKKVRVDGLGLGPRRQDEDDESYTPKGGERGASANSVLERYLYLKRKREERMDEDESDDTKSVVSDHHVDNAGRLQNDSVKNRGGGESHRMGFFVSLMPIVDSLPDDEFLNFQMDIIQDLIKRKSSNSKS